MSDVLARWNDAPLEAAAAQILPCCGSMAWARKMAARRPFQDEAALMAAADEVWRDLNETEWIEAFNSHPRIGESSAPNPSAQRSSRLWLGRCESKKKSRTLAMRLRWLWRTGIATTKISSGESSSCVLRENRRRIFWRFSGAGCGMMREPSFTRQPNSSGRSPISG